MSKPKAFRKVVGGDIATLQASVEHAISEVIRNPLLDGVLLENVSLGAGNTKVPHKLDRNLKGFVIVDRSNAATIYRVTKDDKFLTLNSSAAITVSIWVF